MSSYLHICLYTLCVLGACSDQDIASSRTRVIYSYNPLYMCAGFGSWGPLPEQKVL